MTTVDGITAGMNEIANEDRATRTAPRQDEVGEVGRGAHDEAEGTGIEEV